MEAGTITVVDTIMVTIIIKDADTTGDITITNTTVTIRENATER